LSKPTLFPKIDDETNAKLQARQDLQKLYYDKSSRDLPEVYPGDIVRVLNPFNHKWDLIATTAT
jgi:hypothetical protein